MGRVENLKELTQEFDCKIGALSSSYLGLHLVLSSSLWQFGLAWRKGFRKDYRFGKFLKAGLP